MQPDELSLNCYFDVAPSAPPSGISIKIASIVALVGAALGALLGWAAPTTF